MYSRESQEKYEKCENCQKSISESKIGTHFSYCSRYFKKCDVCQEMYDTHYLQQHEQEYHVKQKCKHCDKQFKLNDLQTHYLTCGPKLKQCNYCDLAVPQIMYQPHLSMCESRTVTCEICQKPVANKFYKNHQSECFQRLCIQNQKVNVKNKQSNTRQNSTISNIISQAQNGRKRAKGQNDEGKKKPISVAVSIFKSHKQAKPKENQNSSRTGNKNSKRTQAEVIDIEQQDQQNKGSDKKQKDPENKEGNKKQQKNKQ